MIQIDVGFECISESYGVTADVAAWQQPLISVQQNHIS